MGRNGNQRPARPRIEIRQSAASVEEAAAIAAAIEQFLRDAAPPVQPAAPATSPWQRAGLREGARPGPGDEGSWGGGGTGWGWA